MLRHKKEYKVLIFTYLPSDDVTLTLKGIEELKLTKFNKTDNGKSLILDDSNKYLKKKKK